MKAEKHYYLVSKSPCVLPWAKAHGLSWTFGCRENFMVLGNRKSADFLVSKIAFIHALQCMVFCISNLSIKTNV